MDVSAKGVDVATHIRMVIYWGHYYLIHFRTTYVTKYITIKCIDNKQNQLFGKAYKSLIGGAFSFSSRNMCQPIGQLWNKAGECHRMFCSGQHMFKSTFINSIDDNVLLNICCPEQNILWHSPALFHSCPIG